ncbi:MAG: hypothetical protein JRJ85_15425, partial [Deltaproteobacteria bacterium]|nr:hypothetical protein [Deltaproteobacteria bacterium]
MAFFSIDILRALDFEVMALSSTQRTDILLHENNSTNTTLVIQAVTAPGVVDPTYNGSAWVSAEVPFPETITDQAVHVNPVFNAAFPYLNAPNNVIDFTNGVWSGTLLISRAKVAANLYIHDAGGNDGRSNVFNLYPGDLNYLWFELSGENFSPQGYYPGNQGVPNDIIAGTTLNMAHDCWVYAVDKSWNQVSLPTSPGINMTIDSPAGGIDVPGSYFMWDFGKTQINGILFRRADPAMQLRATLDGGSGITGLSNPFRVLPDAYSTVVVCAPDNLLIPGGEWRDDDGDTTLELEPRTFGDPRIQRVNDPFVATVYLTDDYFNPAQMPAGGWSQINMYVDGNAAPVKTITPLGSEFYETIAFNTKGWHTVEFRDVSNPARTDTVNINVVSGEVETFEIVGVQNCGAGQPFNVDITAKDGAGNIAENFVGTVNLKLVNNGTEILYDGVIDPATAYFPLVATGGGEITVTARVYYAGQTMGFGDDNLQIKVSTFTPTEKYGLSDSFNIWESTVNDVLIILPGQTYQPGGVPIKVNTANPVVAGDPFNIELYAVDVYGNRVDYDGPADLSLADPEANANLGGSTILIDGYRLGPITIYTAGMQTVNAAITALGVADSSQIVVMPRNYTEDTGKILLLAEGETHKPGWMSVGKHGVPRQVVAHSSMTLTVFACDKFHNIDTVFTGGSVSLISDDGAINNSGIPFVNGVAELSNLYLRGSAGVVTVRVTAQDENDIDRISYSDIDVREGARFSVTVPTYTVVWADFSMTVEVIDSLTGMPGDFNHAVFLEPGRLDYSPGTVPLARTNCTLSSGTVTEPQQHYDHVEHIRIKVTDNFGRLEYSDVIEVRPTGYKYVVECPDESAADSDFNVTIKVYDQLFDAHVVDEAPEHQASIVILEALTGNVAGGFYSVHQVTIRNGGVLFKQQYTKAESVMLRASGAVGAYTAQGSDNINILVGDYVKVQIVAPGEILLPGIPSPTGKDSADIHSQAAREPFTITVNAVDKYWNVVHAIDADRQVELSADDGSLSGYPAAPFQSGTIEFDDVILHVPPKVRVTARDTAGDVYA